MAEEKSAQFTEDRPWISYIFGVIILIIIFFFVFGKGIPFLQKGNPNTTTTKEVSITIEGVLGQPITKGVSFSIDTPSGFNTIIYTKDTTYMKEGGVSSDFSLLKPGIRVRAEGKPNGKMFEAKKIIFVLEKVKVTPTPFNLPGTGIVD